MSYDWVRREIGTDSRLSVAFSGSGIKHLRGVCGTLFLKENQKYGSAAVRRDDVMPSDGYTLGLGCFFLFIHIYVLKLT